MPFVSYSQNFEDVMLWRALRHIERGFYIDLGALSPSTDSVTKAFYDRGWRGINVEPNPEYIKSLRKDRARDINLEVAVGDRSGTFKLFVLSTPGLTTLDPEIAELHTSKGLSCDVIDVTCSTLGEIWSEHVPHAQDVHFLKIDVEGHEAAVINGNDWSKYRPWILVIEATFPNSQRQVHGEWEDALISAGYVMAYWDGLNRFYVAKEHSDILSSLSTPPNIFDDFVQAKHIEALDALSQEMTRKLFKEQEVRRDLEASLIRERSSRQVSDALLANMNASLSWRLTSPFRRLKSLF